MRAGVEGEYPIYNMGHLKLEEVSNSSIDEGRSDGVL
jgi:hypothetical protein